MCILLNVKKHEKTFALNVDIFNYNLISVLMAKRLKSICLENMSSMRSLKLKNERRKEHGRSRR